jgi:predicted anti-sigma-YlaC factor YlaD
MKHEIELLNDLVDGMLSSQEEKQVQQHLAECGDCRKELESIRSLKDKAASLPKSIQPKHDLWKGIESRISSDKPPVVLPFQESKERPVNRRVMRWMQYTLAAAAVVAITIFGMVWLRYYSSSSWRMELVESGSTGAITKQDELRVGDILQTNASTSATIQVGAIGFVNVEPNSTVRLLEATATDHRLALDKGTMHATIFAPPRLFFVETPSALAVDLGCAYTMTVDEIGASFLEVTSGWVSLEYGGRESIIPAGAMCATKPGFGPGTPFQQDASPELRKALLTYDFGLADSTSLSIVLQQARNMDSITLWHLLFRTTGDARAKVYDRLAYLVPPPEGVTRSGMLEGNPEMVNRWQKYLNLGNSSWWKFWH